MKVSKRERSRFIGSVVVGLVGLVGAACGAGCGGGNGKVGDRQRAAATGVGATSVVLDAAFTPRTSHTATLLDSGEVLVVGGLDVTGEPLVSTQFVSATGVRSGPDLASPRLGHSATLLPDGQVLIAGGASDAAATTPMASTEVYDPLTDTFSAGPDLAEARAWHVAEAFDGGQGPRVLVAGGQGTTATLASAEVVDVDQGASTPLSAGLSAPRRDARITMLDGGALLIVSGRDPAGAELFDPAAQTFAALPGVVARAGAAVASNGVEALVIGGASAAGIEGSTEVFDVATQTFAQGVALAAQRRDAAVAMVGADAIVLVGGRGPSGALAEVEVITGASLAQAQVSAAEPLALGRTGHTATAIDATRVLVIGGADETGELIDAIELIDLGAPASSGAPDATATTTPAATAGANFTPTAPPAQAPIANPPPTVAPTPPAPTVPPTAPADPAAAQLAALVQALQQLAANPGAAAPAAPAATAAPAAGGNGLSGLLGNLAGSLVGGLLGNGSAGANNTNGLSGLLSGLLGGGSNTAAPATANNGGGGLGGLLGNLLGGLTGSSNNGGGGLGGLLNGLFGGGSTPTATAPAATNNNSGFLGNLLGGLFGGGSSTPTATNNSNPLGNLLGGLFGGGSTPTATAPAATNNNSGGFLGNLLGGLFGGGSSTPTTTAPAATNNNSGGGLLSGLGSLFGGLFGDDD